MKTHPSWNEIEHVLGAVLRDETRLALHPWSWGNGRFTLLFGTAERFRKGINFARAKSYLPWPASGVNVRLDRNLHHRKKCLQWGNSIIRRGLG